MLHDMDSLPLLGALGRDVRRRRKARGLSRRRLAEVTGISERFLADIEAGRANPSVARLLQIARALETEPSALLRAAEEETRVPATEVVALLGLRGAGKSSIGARLAVRLGRPFVELDRRIEESSGLALAQIFELNGEASFRRAERAALRSVFAEGPRPCVLATSGGIVTDEEAFTLLRENAWTVWLRATPEQHWGRVVAQGDTRPMAGHDAAFEALCEILRERAPFYARAHATIDTTGREVDAIAAELEQRIAALQAPPRAVPSRGG